MAELERTTLADIHLREHDAMKDEIAQLRALAEAQQSAAAYPTHSEGDNTNAVV